MLKVYLCALKKKCYLEEAKICIESLRTNGKFNGPIYLFTDMNISMTNVEVINVNCESVSLAPSFRLKLFRYINNYNSEDIFLYLDTDIVILKPLPNFKFIDNKIHVYGYPLRTQKENSFSGFIDKAFP